MDRERQKSELYKGLWQMANDLRGAVDAWDFKNYVFSMLFYRYLSENLTNYINKIQREFNEKENIDEDFNYEEISDEEAEIARKSMTESLGYYIVPSELFCNIRKNAKDNENLNEAMDKVFKHIEESTIGQNSNETFKGMFDDVDFASNKLGSTVDERNKRLVSLLDGVGGMNLGNYEDNSIDTFGDAYEYLMGMYAANAGKSGGQYFTPIETSKLVLLLGLSGRKQINKCYDCACGSGSLLLQSAKILGNENVITGYYGQEINRTLATLSKQNILLHGIGYEKFSIKCGDTLSNPLHWDDEPFDLIVANPPFSVTFSEADDPVMANDPRFSPVGVMPPKSKADMAFVLHCYSWLANDGKAAIICFPGIFYRGGREQKIRKYLVDHNAVEAIIQLSDGLFFGTSIQADILVLSKSKKDDKTIFIDASKEFVSAPKQNKLSEENIQTIYKWFMDRKEVDYRVKLASIEDIAKEDYNLSVSTYVEPEDTREKIDINVLNAEIEEIVKREEKLRESIKEIIANIEN